MENDVAETVHVPQSSSDVKVHGSICCELRKILDRIASILPAMESARPGSSLGIHALCSLNTSVEKGKLIIQHCSECSKLYLALTGEAILLRCERIKSSLNQSLSQIQNMVPPLLAAQIAQLLDYLRDAKFIIDSTEEGAGKAILELLQRNDSTEELELEAFQIATSKLNLTTPKALLIERRSIKKLLEKICGTDSKKERILKFLLYLLKKYGKHNMLDAGGHKEKFPRIKSTSNIINSEKTDDSADQGDYQINKYGSVMPPEELCCPISAKVMCDPVIIASGQTYERALIEKWFNEGHDTCPKTQKKLENFSLIPNTCMKDLISKWRGENDIEILGPCAKSTSKEFRSWESSNSHSISSLKYISTPLLDGKSADYVYQSDHSNVSFISSENSNFLDSVGLKEMEISKGSSSPLFPWSADYQKYKSFSKFEYDMFLRFFNTLSELTLELQDKAVDNVKVLLEGDEETCYAMLSNGFMDALICFLTNSHEKSNVKALKTGAQLFLAFLSNSRVEILSLSEGAFPLLATLVNSQIRAESLLILERLSHQLSCLSHIVSSGIAPSIIKLLSSEDTKLVERATKILSEISSHSDIKPLLISSNCISTLASVLKDGRLSEYCLKILHNMSDTEEALDLIAKTNGCLASIVEILDIGDRDEQEDAVSILHSVCSHSVENCMLVMKEGVIPALVDISVNGSEEGKETSIKLLRLLRDLRHKECFDSSCNQPVPISEVERSPMDHSAKKQSISKSSRFFSRKMRFFSKPRSVTLF
ncbi:U-box domain-containing protein 7-like [Ananas comosus]|uniref:RING-type E3 ubiquitin transferase n=1 Tax=Ananas comosus TaxID=4615 RepID=A0A6P5G3C2_ANACO|nr:U-box domain-containing protein 7-like [Ananas comosus]XP_020100202.1 U-box domain-containing protein 7-like [Ananas comosus]XP_020100203.1 U-box domain-containing protein 7-like [Ananas comosus]XP_020100204.1 U-box domain-containing protein 7-like [Ananas comosus]